MFKEARSCIPSLSTWLEFCYSSPSFLHFGDHTINSICGVLQGDPLGPLGFALTLLPIIKNVKSEVPGLLANSWYLDVVLFVAHLVILTWLYLSLKRLPLPGASPYAIEIITFYPWRGLLTSQTTSTGNTYHQ